MMGHIWRIGGNGMDGLTHTLEMVMNFAISVAMKIVWSESCCFVRIWTRY